MRVSYPDRVTLDVLKIADVHGWTNHLMCDADVTDKIIRDVSWHTGARIPLFDREVLRRAKQNRLMTLSLQPKMKASDQEASGRCWAFAGLSLMRRRLAREMNLSPSFELSQSFVLFYDKLEKANAFLRHVQGTRHLPEGDRTVLWLYANAVTDGGTWSTFQALVKKYGIVPSVIMPESVPANRTRYLNELLRTLLRSAAHRIRKAPMGHTGEEGYIRRVLQGVHRLLVTCLGDPPTGEFDWTYEDTKNEDAKVKTLRMTPHRLYDMVRVDDYVELVHCPTHTIGQAYRLRFGEVVLGIEMERPLYNVSLEDVVAATTKSLVEKNTEVWFSCEYDAMRLAAEGILHHELVDLRRVYEPHLYDTLCTSRTERLRSRLSSVDHAMLITGCHVESDRPVRWEVENSHGDYDTDGYLTMTHEWFKKYAFGVVVHKNCIDKDLSCRNFEYVDHWDDFGAVMCRGDVP